MHKSTSSPQLGIFGDGWIYKMVLGQAKDNPLIGLRPLVDKVLIEADAKIKSYYSPYEARSSFSPSVPFKMILLEYLYGLSDVRVSKESVHDFLFRWFIGVEPTEPVPDDSTLVRFRGRLKEESFREIFDKLVEITKEQGLIKGKLRAIDGTHVFADTPKPGPIALIKQGVRKVLREIKRLHMEVGTHLEKRYEPWLKKTVKRGGEKIETARVKGKRFVQDVREAVLHLASTMNDATERAKKKVLDRVKEVVDLFENVVDGNDLQIVSFTDPPTGGP